MAELASLSRVVPPGCVFKVTGSSGQAVHPEEAQRGQCAPRPRNGIICDGNRNSVRLPAAPFASEYMARTHPLPASHPSRAMAPAPPRPCPVPALAPPATLLVTLHWQWWAAMPRPERGPRSPSREGKGVGLGQLSTGNVSLRHSFSPHRPHAQCLGIQCFGLGKRHYTVCIYGTHLPLDAIIPWSKLQKRVAAQVCCSPFSQALGSSL